MCVLLCAHTHRALCASCFCLVLCCSSTCVCVYMSGRCSAGGVSCRPCCSSSLPGGAAGVCGLRLFSLAGASAWSCWDVAEWAALASKWHAPLTTPALSRAHTAPTHAPHATRTPRAAKHVLVVPLSRLCEWFPATTTRDVPSGWWVGRLGGVGCFGFPVLVGEMPVVVWPERSSVLVWMSRSVVWFGGAVVCVCWCVCRQECAFGLCV